MASGTSGGEQRPSFPPFDKGGLGGIFLPGLFFALSLGLATCGPRLPPEPLEAVPHPDLTTAEDAVRRQLTTTRTDVETLLADSSAKPADQAAALGELAGLYQAYDLLDAAAACYRNAARLAPDEPRWPHLLGVVERYEGRLAESAAAFDRALALAGDDEIALASLLHRAEVAVDLRNLDEAETLARRALEWSGERSPAAFQVLGKVAEAHQEWPDAVAAYQRALELDPAADKLHYLLGQAHRQAGDLGAAREHLRQAGQADTAFADPFLADIYTDVMGSAVLMQRAASAKAAGSLQASVDIYRRAVANDPRSPEARRDLGALLAQTGRWAESADQYREALRLEPAKALNHFVLALVLEQVAKQSPDVSDPEILGLMAKAVELAPDYAEFRRVLAERLAARGRFDEALGHFQRLVADDPADGSARLELAKVRLALGDAAGALVDARAVTVSGEVAAGRRAEALGVVGEALARQGDAAAATHAFRQALELDADLAGAHFGLANLAGMAGRFDEAVAGYRRALESDPGRVAAWLGEATALALSGREAEAAERLETACRSLGDPPPLVFTLARLRLAASDPQVRDADRAVALAETLVARQPTPDHGELLAVSLAAAGRFAEAVAMQQNLLKAMPPGTDPLLEARWRGQLADWRRRIE